MHIVNAPMRISDSRLDSGIEARFRNHRTLTRNEREAKELLYYVTVSVHPI